MIDCVSKMDNILIVCQVIRPRMLQHSPYTSKDLFNTPRNQPSRGAVDRLMWIVEQLNNIPLTHRESGLTLLIVNYMKKLRDRLTWIDVRQPNNILFTPWGSIQHSSQLAIQRSYEPLVEVSHHPVILVDSDGVGATGLLHLYTNT